MKTEESLRSAFAAIRAALMANDVAAIRRLVAADYCGFDPGGVPHDRDLMLEAYKPGGVHLDTYEVSDLVTRIIGDVGLAMGLGVLSGSYGEQKFAHNLRFLDVYVYDGAWQLSVSQVTETQAEPKAR